jgi:hypothetical protein
MDHPFFRLVFWKGWPGGTVGLAWLAAGHIF